MLLHRCTCAPTFCAHVCCCVPAARKQRQHLSPPAYDHYSDHTRRPCRVACAAAEGHTCHIPPRCRCHAACRCRCHAACRRRCIAASCCSRTLATSASTRASRYRPSPSCRQCASKRGRRARCAYCTATGGWQQYPLYTTSTSTSLIRIATTCVPATRSRWHQYAPSTARCEASSSARERNTDTDDARA